MGKKQAPGNRKQPTAKPVVGERQAGKQVASAKKAKDRPALGRGLCPRTQPPVHPEPPTRLVELLSGPAPAPPPETVYRPPAISEPECTLPSTLKVHGLPIAQYELLAGADIDEKPPARFRPLLVSLLRRLGRGVDASHRAAPLLAGLAIGWQLCGMQTIFAAEIDPLPATATMVVVLAFLLAAVGMGVPERAMSVLHRLIPRRLVPHPPDDPQLESDENAWLLQIGPDRDPALPALSLALASAAAGIVGILWLGASRPAFATYHWMLERFFWNSSSLAVLEWICVGLLLAVPWIINGLLAVTLSVVADSHPNAPNRNVAGHVWPELFLGVAVAMLTHLLGSNSGFCGEREVLIASLPLLTLAVFAARSSQRAEGKQSPRSTTESSPPELSAESETLVRMACATWGVGVAAACSGWLACRSGIAAGAPQWFGSPPSLLIGMTAGFILAIWRQRHKDEADDGCGLSVWASGLGIGIAATLAAMAGHILGARNSGPAANALTVLQEALISIPAGFALQHLMHSWVARASSRTLGFAQFSLTMLTGTAIGLAVSRWWALPSLGAMGTLSAGSLALLATGGLIEIYENERSLLVQRVRLGLVFASLAAAIALFPANTRAWTRLERQSAALVASDTAPSAPLLEALGQVRTACLIGTMPGSLPPQLPPRLTQLHLLPIVSWPPRPTNTAIDPRATLLAGPAWRTLRLSHKKYQLIDQVAGPTNVGLPVECSAECLNTLAARLNNGGRLMLEVPLAGLDPASIASLAATFEHVCGPACTWTVIEQPAPRIIFNAGGVATQAFKWHPCHRLTNASPVTIHAIRRAHPVDPQSQQQDVLDWLHAAQNP